VISPAEKAAFKRDQDKKEVKEQLEKAGVIDKTDPRDVFWENVKDTGVSEQTVAVLFDQLVQKRKHGMTDSEIGTEIKRALLEWIRTNKPPRATPNLQSQQRPQLIIRPSNVTEISTHVMKLFIKGQVETARQSSSVMLAGATTMRPVFTTAPWSARHGLKLSAMDFVTGASTARRPV
jgi:hypothetical protein